MPDESVAARNAANSLLGLLAAIDDKLLMFGGARMRLLLHSETAAFRKLVETHSPLFDHRVNWELSQYLEILATVSAAAATHRTELTDSEWSDEDVVSGSGTWPAVIAQDQYLALLSQISLLQRHEASLHPALLRIAGA